MSSEQTGVRALPPARVVLMVAGREISTRVRTKAFLISNAVILAIIAGGLIATSVLQGQFDKPPAIGLVGPAKALSAPVNAAAVTLSTEVKTRDVATEAEARRLLAEGDLKVALIAKGRSYTLLTQKRVPAPVQGVISAAVRQQAVAEALLARHVDPLKLAADVARRTLVVEAVEPPKKDADQRTALAFAAVGLLYMQLLGNGIAVASSVVSEKTSRVIELLLSTIKPLHLLVGKIAGIGVVGLLQLAAYAAVGLVVGGLTGLVTVSSSANAVFAGTLCWYVLGYCFLSVLYAAAGSMVSRQEEVGSTTGPLSFLVIAMFAVAQASVQNPDGTMASIMSWIPPFSAILMPLRIAAGVTGPVQVVGTVLLMLLTSSALAVLCARIYQRSILRMGTRVSWKQAFGRG
jgi:ABC-2 type transport system permease protein